jgi:hypothetical protein
MRFLIAALFFLCVSSASAADKPLPARHRIHYSSLLAARLNPLGLEEQIAVGYRLRLYESPKILWRDCFVGLDFTPVLNPAQVRVGAELTVKPIALLSLAARYSFLSWVGTFEYLQSYTSPHADHSDSALDEGKENDQNYATTGGQLQLHAQVLGKVGPIVLRNDLKLFHTDADLRSDDRVFYSITIDAMVPDGGWALTNDTDLVWMSSFGLVAGVRTSVVHAFYRDGDYLPGESTDNPNTPHVRVGPIVAYVFYDRPESWFNKPTVLVILNWFVKHRYRTGADVSQGMPYVVLGFRFSGDLWSRD